MTPAGSKPQAYVYIISNKSHRLYIGIAVDLLARVEEHRTGAYPNGFTARYHFDRLVYFEVAATKRTAARREKELKGWSRPKKVALIQAMNPNWLDLTPRLHWSATLV
ncbi:MAG TPA: GIY-YIG nuclease family protein [Thermoanaerobaculia bacterium]|nr:GIY-YIG nuclease family protein [Thermoanaerobaculia bacterium]